MSIGQIRTWPKISMISNRMRIEASIEKVRKSLRHKKKVSSSKSGTGSYTSDFGSSDEVSFLSRRRVSLPTECSKKEKLHEQSERRKFMAQFKENTNSFSTSLENSYSPQSDTDISLSP